jgi:hypothetical protein
MTLPTNVLQTVQTYQMSELAYLLNSFAFISTANKKFKDFEKLEANLGDTVTFDLPPRYTTTNSLIATFQDSQQRVQSLTVDQSSNVAAAFSAQQFIFNVEKYMDKFGKAAIQELGTKIEANVAKTIVDHTYRFYGDGVTAINSYGQLATAIAYFNNYGSAKNNLRGYLSDIIVPGIVNTGLSQFVMNRNEKDAQSWELGKFKQCEWYESNLLPVHTSGTVGNGASAAVQTLTVVSTNDPTGANITQITCTCDASLSGSADAIKANDVAYFLPASGLNYLTFIGHEISSNPVQIRITADAVASGTTVVINVSPALVAVANQNQNINKNIVAGMTLKVMPSHRAGLITSGNSLFLAMPRLPEEIPFPTANASDPDSGASIRGYYGSSFGQNQRGYVHDAIWGKTLVDEYSMRILFPL